MKTRKGALAALAAAVALIAAVAMLGVSPGPAQESGDEVLNFNSEMALDPFNGAIASGTPIVQWPPHGGVNQGWTVFDLGTVSGTLKVVIFQNHKSGHVLTANGTGAGAGLTASLWAGTAPQIWLAAPFGDTGLDVLINGGSGLVADVPGSSVTAGQPVIVWTWLGGVNQLWSLPEVTPVTTTTTTAPSTTSTTSASTSTTDNTGGL